MSVYIVKISGGFMPHPEEVFCSSDAVAKAIAKRTAEYTLSKENNMKRAARAAIDATQTLGVEIAIDERHDGKRVQVERITKSAVIRIAKEHGGTYKRATDALGYLATIDADLTPALCKKIMTEWRNAA